MTEEMKKICQEMMVQCNKKTGFSEEEMIVRRTVSSSDDDEM